MDEEDNSPPVTVNVEVKDSTTRTILIAAVVVLGGVSLAMLLLNDGGVLGGDHLGLGGGTCGDGVDNDNGGQADRDDPDCYNNPEVWQGYDDSRDENDPQNDPPGGRP